VGRHVVLLVFAAVGCTGEIDPSIQEGLTPEQQVAQDRWVMKALPALKNATCISCHDGSMAGAVPEPPAYLAGMTDLKIRDTLMAATPAIVNLGSPAVSRLIKKGMHEGPPLSAQAVSDVQSWIEAERDARPAQMVFETAHDTPPTLCMGMPTCPINTITLDALGLAGAKFEYSADVIAPDLYVTQMKFTAGADGIYLEHPLFDSWPAGAMKPTPDSIDRYFATQLNIMPGMTATLAASATFANFAGTDPVSLRFDAIEKYRPQ
jgi:hypothetical protein